MRWILRRLFARSVHLCASFIFLFFLILEKKIIRDPRDKEKTES